MWEKGVLQCVDFIPVICLYRWETPPNTMFSDTPCLGLGLGFAWPCQCVSTVFSVSEGRQ